MVAFLLNPGGKRRRKGRGRKRGARGTRRRKLTRRQRSWRARRAARKRRSHVGRVACSTRIRKIIDRFACGEGGVRRFAALRKRCHTRAKAKELASAAERSASAAAFYASHPGTAANGRRRRRYNSSFKFKYNRRRRARNTWFPAMAANNPYWVPAYAMNPGGAISRITSGFQPRVLTGVVPMVGGAIGNTLLTNAVTPYLPSMLKTGLPNTLFKVASAGVLGAGMGMLPFTRKYAGSAFMGAVLAAAVEAVAPYAKRFSGMVGLGDYLTVQNAASARPLNGLGLITERGAVFEDWSPHDDTTPEGFASRVQRSATEGSFGMNLTSTPESYAGLPLGLNDYLTVQNARSARPLNGFGSHTLNDAVIESAATEDLSMGG